MALNFFNSHHIFVCIFGKRELMTLIYKKTDLLYRLVLGRVPKNCVAAYRQDLLPQKQIGLYPSPRFKQREYPLQSYACAYTSTLCSDELFYKCVT